MIPLYPCPAVKPAKASSFPWLQSTMDPTFAQSDPCSGAPSQHSLHAPPPVSWLHLPVLRPMLASPGLCYGCLLLGSRCSCGLALARFLTHSRRGVTLLEGRQGRWTVLPQEISPGLVLPCPPPPQHSMELPLPEAAKNTPDRNPASLQQTRKLGPLKLRAGLWWKGSAGLLWGLQGPCRTLHGARLTSGVYSMPSCA